MRTAHSVVAAFCSRHAIDMKDFWEWFSDGNHTQDEANVHDSRFFALLEDYVAERNAGETAATPTLMPSPLCLSILGPDGFTDFTQAATQAQRITHALGKKSAAFWEIQAVAGRQLELRLRLYSPDDADPDTLPFHLTFSIPYAADRTEMLSPAESRLFIVNDTVWTARELIEQDSVDVPGLAATRRWINRKERFWDVV